MAEQSLQPPHEGLGKAIAMRRTELGLKRRGLADRAELSYPYISEIENGLKEPSPAALGRIAQALEMDRSELMILSERYDEAAGDHTSLHRHAPETRTERSPLLQSIAEAPPLAATWSLLAARPTSAHPEQDEVPIEELVRSELRRELDAWATYRLPDLIRRELERLLPELLDRPDA